MRLSVIAAAAVLTFATVARADQMHDREPIPDPEQPAPQQLHEKSPELAVGLSIGATVGGYFLMSQGNGYAALGFGAAFLGPSAGQWYAGKTGALGIGGRAVGLTMMLYGAVHLMSGDCADCSRSSSDISDERRAKFYLGAGAALWVGSTIYDFVQAYRETDRYNRDQRAMFAPTLIPAYNGTQAPGMAFSTTF